MYKRWIPLLQNKKVILASGSPRRIELLSGMGIDFTSKVSDFPEDLSKEGVQPNAYVRETSLKKFEFFIQNNPTLDFDILITADTVVEFEGKILEKPKDADEVRQWFKLYSENKVRCYTCTVIGVIKKNEDNTNQIVKSVDFTVQTDVYFDKLSDEVIEDYIKTGEPFGKAGGFAIQGDGKYLIKKIDGCFYNVIGFPVHEFAKHLDKLLSDYYGHVH